MIIFDVNLQGMAFTVNAYVIIEEIKEKFSQATAKVDRNLLFIYFLNENDLPDIIANPPTISGFEIPVTRSFPEEANLVRFRIEKLKFMVSG